MPNENSAHQGLQAANFFKENLLEGGPAIRIQFPRQVSSESEVNESTGLAEKMDMARLCPCVSHYSIFWVLHPEIHPYQSSVICQFRKDVTPSHAAVLCARFILESPLTNIIAVVLLVGECLRSG